MTRRPPRATPIKWSAASDVYKRQLRVLHLKLLDLSTGEDSGIPSVAVECVDIRRNISGEGDYLDSN